MGGDGGMKMPSIGDIGLTLMNPFAAAQYFGGKKVVEEATKPPTIDAPPAPGPVPTPANSQDATDDAMNKQNRARGSAATTFAGRTGGEAGNSSLLGSGSSVSQRMLLGS